MLEDKVLVRRFRSGDVAALERIYQKYKNELLALALSLANDITTAEDAVVEAPVPYTFAPAEDPEL